MNLILPARPPSCSASSVPEPVRLVDHEQAVRLAAETVQQVLGGALGGVARGAGVLVRREQREPRPGRREPRQKALLAGGGAGRTVLEAQQDHAALAAEQASHLVGRQLSALAVVRGDETHDLVGGQSRVDNHGRDAESLRFLDRPHERLLVERGEHDAVDALTGEGLHDLHLLLAVVLAQRPLPDQLDLQAGGFEVACTLDGAGMHRTPELHVGRLRHDRDAQRAVPARRARTAAAGRRGSERDRQYAGHPAGTDERGAHQAFHASTRGLPFRVRDLGTCVASCGWSDYLSRSRAVNRGRTSDWTCLPAR